MNCKSNALKYRKRFWRKAFSAASRIIGKNDNFISEILSLENEQKNIFQTVGEQR